MVHGMRRRALVGIVVAAGMAVSAPAAMASVSPTVSVTTSTPVAAGSTGTLGLDIKLNPSSGDAPDGLTINLPAGVLADVSIDNGACITTTITDFSDDAACQLGSGTVTALASGVVPVPTPVVFYLTPPPAAGDLAGLAVATGAGDQIGSTDGINIRPSGSADGVGVTLDLTLPNSLDGAPVSVSEINSTFTGVRFPATCPSTAADITLSASTYASPSSSATASAPLPVTGCSSLPYDPQYSLTAAKDSGDKVVKLTTTITQAATESPDSSVSLTFPLNSLSASISALHSLCSAGVTSGTCTAVGSVTADSPDYPTALTGQAYLTGSLTGLSLTLAFPAPFPLTLVGSVNLKTNTTTFTGLPDIPLTSLVVALNGGANGLFDTNCATPTNTSTTTLTDQNGDKTATPSSRFTISGCPTSASAGGGAGGSGESGSGSSSGGATATAHLTTGNVRGLRRGRPTLRFSLTASRASKLKSFTVTLPKGLSFVTGKVHQRLEVKGLSLKGADLKSERLRHGVLTITLRHGVRRVTVTVGSSGLMESKALRRAANSKSGNARRQVRR
jgi:hypothetical protein